MDFNKFFDISSKKVSHKTLVLIIVFLLIAIAVIIAGSIKKKHDVDKASDTSPSTASMSESIPEKVPLVVIDPGHGGWEPGAGNGKLNEKDIVLDISLEIEKLLAEKSIEYHMIRTDDTYVSLEDRARIANELKAKLFISIHNNSFTDASQSGILTTYNPNSPIGREIAKLMQSKIKDIGMRNREIMPRPNLYVLRHTEMPALLLEIGFISNKKDLKLLTDTEFQKTCAQQIVSGIEDILDNHILDSATADEVKNPEAD